MTDAQIKHLELIQGIINRLAGNSFAMKGWAVTISAALFALGAKDAHPSFVLAALLPTIAFWLLDGFYLRQERLFRALYDYVRQQDSSSWDSGRFSMDTRPFTETVNSWPMTVVSRTLLGFYLPLSLAIVVVAALQFGLMLISVLPRCQ